ncbi:MAG TPA: glycosyltransferase [Phycisphaerae bacterium]|nr:glycosyltransferase [Phycisphaerae bacterium]
MPLKDRLIICIASSWDIDPTSKHQVMRILSQTNDVLWVNYHGSRRPSLNRKDARSALGALKRVASGLRPIHERMSQLTPLVIPGARDLRVRKLNEHLVVSQIKRAVRTMRKPNQPVQLWTFAPDVDFLAGRFDEERLVYYCVDDFAAFEGFDAEAINAAEARLAGKADVVLATSKPLLEKCQRLHSNVHLVRHGVDHDHFASALDRRERPDALQSIPRPIAGFVGLIDHWFDVQLVSEVAKRMPDVSFVLIGDVRVDVGPLADLPNVHLLGRKPYAELPGYLASFDVGLIPFVRNQLTESVNPIKLREYLAAGLGVVSTDLPEVRRYDKFVLLTDESAAFADACRSAIASNNDDARRKRSNAMVGESWQSVTNRLCDIVMTLPAASHEKSATPHICLASQ